MVYFNLTPLSIYYKIFVNFENKCNISNEYWIIFGYLSNYFQNWWKFETSNMNACLCCKFWKSTQLSCKILFVFLSTEFMYLLKIYFWVTWISWVISYINKKYKTTRIFPSKYTHKSNIVEIILIIEFS